MKKIRVLHCVTAMNRGGLETLIMNFYRNIDKDTFEFDFLTQRDYTFDYSDEINQLGGRIYSVPAFNPFHIKEYRNAIDNFFKEHAKDYDIVHAHNNSFAMYVLRAAQKYGVKVRISHSHIANSMINLKLPFVIYNKMKLKKYCNVQFACGEKAGKWLFGNDKSLVIPNAVDLANFSYNEIKRKEIRNKYNIDEGTTVIGHVGRFNKQKNHTFMIDIMKWFKDNKINAKLFLIGSGQLQSEIQEKVKRLNLEEYVLFIGSVDNVYDYLNSMDVFILPSFIEGLPVTLIEAQANGIQCLISDSIPSECKVTSLISFLSLKEPINVWCEKILELSKITRKNEISSIIKSGFEIKSATKRIEQKYIELVNENN